MPTDRIPIRPTHRSPSIPVSPKHPFPETQLPDTGTELPDTLGCLLAPLSLRALIMRAIHVCAEAIRKDRSVKRFRSGAEW